MKTLFINLVRFFLFFTFFFYITNYSAESKNITTREYQKYLQEIPIYPSSKIYDLKDKLNIRMIAHITTDTNFQKIVDFYTLNMKKKGWNVLFPSNKEMKIWFQALNSDRTKPPVITIVLNKEKTKINCNLMIGVTKDARLATDLTIITIYLSDTVLR